jgi:hypothetical protein
MNPEAESANNEEGSNDYKTGRNQKTNNEPRGRTANNEGSNATKNRQKPPLK